jgi:type IV pilus assembly protein PilA
MNTMRKGFSLVELMIVVAIIGILAAIAIPNFVAMQLKAKRSEVPSNVDGIKTSEVAYEAAFDSFIDAAAKPGSLAKTQRAWTVTADGFSSIGWKPDGAIRGSYAVTGSGATDFLVTGSSDVDGDLDVAVYTATVSVNTTLTAGDENVY